VAQSQGVDLGLQAYHDYHGGDIDHVNVDNGNLTLTIPLASYPQRGSLLKLDFAVVYNGSGLTYGELCVPGQPGKAPICSYGWLPSHSGASPIGMGVPQLVDSQNIGSGDTVIPIPNTDPQQNFDEVSWATSDGGVHQGGQTSTGQISVDGSGFQAGYIEGDMTETCTWGCTIPTTTLTPPVSLFGTRNGISYIEGQNGRARVDPDGNYIFDDEVSGITDTVGRYIPYPVVNSSPTQSQITVCNNVNINSIAVWSPPGYSQPFTFCYISGVLQSIALPNGQSWVFEYNEAATNCPYYGAGTAGPSPPTSTINLGDLTQVKFPTGGTITYNYTCVKPATQLEPLHSYVTAVASRTLNDGANHQWTYSYGSDLTGNTTMTDPAGNDTVDTVTTSSRVTTEYSGTGSGRTMMRQTSLAFPSQYATISGFPMYPTSKTVTLENGISTQTAYQYCCDISLQTSLLRGSEYGDVYPYAVSYGKVTDTKTYDFTSGSQGPLLKETATSYLFQSNTNYMNPGFFDLVQSSTTYDGSGNQMAQTTFGFDETSRVTSGIASLSGANMTSPIFSVYGHQTSKTSWLNGGTNPKSTVSYLDTGEPYQGTDPKGNVTSTYYCTGSSPTTLPCSASTYLGALPTVVSNALGQQSSFSYLTATGQKQTTTDPNGQTTNYTYSDPMARLTNIAYPDGGNTGIQYNDTGSEIGVTVTEKVTSAVNKQTQAIVDGLGRLSETILLSDPSGATYTLTTYDGMGRKYQVWNPTRCTPTSTPCAGETTWGITTYDYDALSREILLIPPDGTSTTDNQATSYSGNTVTVKDEAGNSRTSTSDALGRLTQVSEGTQAYITAYTYDALSNLLCVEQHGGVTATGCSSPSSDDATSQWRVRRFTYDSLSRLITAKNPETGTITYGYDADNVLTSKIDNRGITITYTPDALHRITKKTYSDGEPAITYGYDAYVSGTNYGIGRRTSMSDASGSTAWTYDPMGRVWSEQQTINGHSKTTSNLYTYGGYLKQITYPSGAVVAVTTGGDGRTLSVTDSTHSLNYAKSLLYAPPGELATSLYGYSSSYAGIAETKTFNSRGQPIRFQDCGLASCTDGSSSPTPYLMDLNYNYGLGVNDNGNVQGITNNKNTARSQAFTYDGLNRLLTAKSGSTWGISFSGGIDPWGNLYQTNTISGTASNPMSVNQAANVKNQFTLLGYSYDAAGNVLTDGINSGCGTNAYTWNAEEQMTCAAGSTYTYDGDGIRVEKTGGSATPTLYWGTGTLAESDTSGNLTSEYIFLNGRRIARRDISTGNVYYYFSDALGSSNVLANSAGVLQNESDFYPFGGELPQTQNVTNQHYKFTSKERDTETGNDYFGARFDSSSMGRFMSPDWANSPEPVPYAKMGNPQSLNLYAFTMNNPESSPDLDGHETEVEQFNQGFAQSLSDACGDGITFACGGVNGGIQNGDASKNSSLGQNAESLQTQSNDKAQENNGTTLPTGSQLTMVQTLMGEQTGEASVGTNQYGDDQSGRNTGPPTGAQITDATLDKEASLMAGTMLNLGHIGNAKTYRGLPAGKHLTALAAKAKPGSALAIQLQRDIGAVKNATPSPYSQWRAVNQGFIRSRGDALRVAGTDFIP
jgi:RHS repeat-associated protein